MPNAIRVNKLSDKFYIEITDFAEDRHVTLFSVSTTSVAKCKAWLKSAIEFFSDEPFMQIVISRNALQFMIDLLDKE